MKLRTVEPTRIMVRDMSRAEKRERAEKALRHALYQVAGIFDCDIQAAASFARGYMIAARLKPHEMEERMRR